MPSTVPKPLSRKFDIHRIFGRSHVYLVHTFPSAWADSGFIVGIYPLDSLQLQEQPDFHRIPIFIFHLLEEKSNSP